MPERTHLSIGEVLSLLREEFPDVTISKIRFLESQGLVDPERTPSGYRKFYDHDVDRLRWILRQQREHFLPLKVIRGRLSEGADRPSGTGRPATVEHTDEHPALAPPRPRGAGVEAERPPAPVTALRPPADADHSDDEPAPVPPLGQTADNGRAGSAIPSSARGERGVMGESDAGAAGAGERDPGSAAGRLFNPPAEAAPAGPAGDEQPPDLAAADEPVPATAGRGGDAGGAPRPAEATPEAAPSTPDGEPGAGRSGAARSGGDAADAGRKRGDGEESETPAGRPAGGRARRRRAQPPSDDDTYTLDELAEASGLPEAAIADLDQYGLIVASSSGGTAFYPADALDVAKAAAGFASHGIEARHLRVWRTAADRESALFEQVVTPLVRQRNPQAREQASATLDELTGHAAALHEALLRRALKEQR